MAWAQQEVAKKEKQIAVVYERERVPLMRVVEDTLLDTVQIDKETPDVDDQAA
jgi:hypothetical protein